MILLDASVLVDYLRSPTDRILHLFEENVEISEGLWDVLGKNLSLLRGAGVTVPFPDALLATLAIESGLELWAHDSHFPQIQRVLPALRLFQEPAA